MMKTTVMFAMLMSACVVEPSEAMSVSDICVLDEDGDWIGDCGSIPGGGGGGPGGETCEMTSCGSQWQCQFSCMNPLAVCVFPGVSGIPLGTCYDVNWL